MKFINRPLQFIRQTIQKLNSSIDFPFTNKHPTQETFDLHNDKQAISINTIHIRNYNGNNRLPRNLVQSQRELGYWIGRVLNFHNFIRTSYFNNRIVKILFTMVYCD